jgi:hypothetical protein
MTVPFAQPAAGSAGRADSAPNAERATGPFVINLCSSNTPMALSQPQSAELRRFTFFVSRRFEDRRERFRLHMGYFDSLHEAEEWLSIVRDVYPGAWAGEAPGKRLREQAAAAGGAAPSAVTPRPTSPAPAPRPVAPTPTPPAIAAVAVPRQTLASAAAAPAPPTNRQPVQAPKRPQAPAPQPRHVPTLQAATPAAKVAAAPAKVAAPPAANRSRAPSPSAPAPTRLPGAALRAPAKAADPGQRSNVREVLAALDETGSTRQMPAVQPTNVNASLTDTQVLKILENRRIGGKPVPEAEAGINLLRPDDTGTRQALKAAVVANAPVWFAVQLHWSVQQIDLARVPPLAIFGAYTLYTVEGSREGRRWYGLRLGFFSDAMSAKQVAYYVRSEFTSVAVIPVSTQERDRASTAEERSVVARKTSAATVHEKLPDHSTEEFKLFDETVPAVPTSAPPAPVARAAAPAKPAHAAAAGKRSVKSPSGRVRPHEKRSVPSLEETLEILGADQLEIDTGSGEGLNDSGVRHLKVSIQKNSAFSRLLERLSERVGKS